MGMYTLQLHHVWIENLYKCDCNNSNECFSLLRQFWNLKLFLAYTIILNTTYNVTAFNVFVNFILVRHLRKPRRVGIYLRFLLLITSIAINMILCSYYKWTKSSKSSFWNFSSIILKAIWAGFFKDFILRQKSAIIIILHSSQITIINRILKKMYKKKYYRLRNI